MLLLFGYLSNNVLYVVARMSGDLPFNKLPRDTRSIVAFLVVKRNILMSFLNVNLWIQRVSELYKHWPFWSLPLWINSEVIIWKSHDVISVLLWNQNTIDTQTLLWYYLPNHLQALLPWLKESKDPVLFHPIPLLEIFSFFKYDISQLKGVILEIGMDQVNTRILLDEGNLQNHFF